MNHVLTLKSSVQIWLNARLTDFSGLRKQLAMHKVIHNLPATVPATRAAQRKWPFG